VSRAHAQESVQVIGPGVLCATVCLSASVPALARTRHPFAVSGLGRPHRRDHAAKDRDPPCADEAAERILDRVERHPAVVVHAARAEIRHLRQLSRAAQRVRQIPWLLSHPGYAGALCYLVEMDGRCAAIGRTCACVPHCLPSWQSRQVSPSSGKTKTRLSKQNRLLPASCLRKRSASWESSLPEDTCPVLAPHPYRSEARSSTRLRAPGQLLLSVTPVGCFDQMPDPGLRGYCVPKSAVTKGSLTGCSEGTSQSLDCLEAVRAFRYRSKGTRYEPRSAVGLAANSEHLGHASPREVGIASV
jgi:hypothetical protein